MYENRMPSEATLIAEYTAAQEDYMHNDSFPWQIGSVLIAGTFVFWAFLLDKEPTPVLLGAGSLLVTLLMSAWILRTSQYRQIYLCKLHRLQEIERVLGMQSHRRWVENPPGEGTPFYHDFGPRGHTIDVLIYCITSLGTSFIGLLKVGANPWLGLPVPVLFAVVAWVKCNERRLKKLLARRDRPRSA